MTADRSELAALKDRLDLVDFLQSLGLVVKREGRGYKALCPFHEDQTPSFSVDRQKGLWHCFGCGKGGDVLTFLQLHKKLSFSAALEELRQAPPRASQRPPTASELKEIPFELLERVAEIWHCDFCSKPHGQSYLEGRGIRDRRVWQELRIGYCDGQHLSKLVTAEERGLLQQAGVFNERGREVLARCVVFPLFNRHNRVSGFYGRSTLASSQVAHRLCGNGLFFPQAAHGSSRVHLVEGILDALAMVQAGFPNTLALKGAQSCTHDLVEHLAAAGVTEIVLCLDGDRAGQRAAAELRERIAARGFQVAVVVFPEGQDPASVEVSHLRSILGQPLQFKPETPMTPPSPEPVVPFSRSYRKLSLAQGKLKILIKLEFQGRAAQEILDLYSNRSRRQAAVSLANELGLDPHELESWFFTILDDLQKQAEQDTHGQDAFAVAEPQPMAPEERAEALAFLQQPDLVQQLLRDLELLGYMGDEDAKLLCFLIAVSRKLEKPMSGILQSGSGAGKSYLAELIAKLTPPEDVVLYSRLSQQALYHMPENFLVHKLLMLEERAGGEVADYQIRTLQSSRFLHQAIVVKDPASGKLSTRSNRVNGPIAYLETTTELKLNPENTSRCFEIPLDESPEQTRRIHERQKALKGLEGLLRSQHEETIVKRHHHAQRLLQPIPVVIPYVQHLVFPDRWLRTRRDHDRFLCLIEVLTFVHQHQRERKVFEGVEYIEASLEDYAWAYRLARRVLPNSLDELSRWARELLVAFESFPAGTTTTRRELRDKLRWPDRRLRDALEELVQMEHLEQLRSTQGNLFLYRLLSLSESGPQDKFGLLSPEELRRCLTG